MSGAGSTTRLACAVQVVGRLRSTTPPAIDTISAAARPSSRLDRNRARVDRAQASLLMMLTGSSRSSPPGPTRCAPGPADPATVPARDDASVLASRYVRSLG